ncbi:MAG TPA: hypothetical protein VD973_20020 [Symbiobacteriaceae bacterium]|nr:hypothetical protein [Symbiobacteriaceae bacterium]
MRRRVVGLVIGAACILCAVSAGARAPQDRARVVAETRLALTGAAVADKAALDRAMAGLGWVPLPVVAQGERGETEGTGPSGGAPGALVDGSYLSMWLTAYRHEEWPMLTVFGSYHWRSCHFATLHGSYDVLGLDWADTDLALIDLGTNDGYRIWYRGESPFQRSAVFNAKDPLKKSGLWPTCDGGTLDGSAFVVFDVGNADTERLLQFNARYDHTYMVKTTKETWSAGLSWEPALKGNVSYTVEVAAEERVWSKGAYLSVRWQ